MKILGVIFHTVGGFFMWGGCFMHNMGCALSGDVECMVELMDQRKRSERAKRIREDWERIINNPPPKDEEPVDSVTPKPSVEKEELR